MWIRGETFPDKVHEVERETLPVPESDWHLISTRRLGWQENNRTYDAWKPYEFHAIWNSQKDKWNAIFHDTYIGLKSA